MWLLDKINVRGSWFCSWHPWFPQSCLPHGAKGSILKTKSRPCSRFRKLHWLLISVNGLQVPTWPAVTTALLGASTHLVHGVLVTCTWCHASSLGLWQNSTRISLHSLFPLPEMIYPFPPYVIIFLANAVRHCWSDIQIPFTGRHIHLSSCHCGLNENTQLPPPLSR